MIAILASVVKVSIWQISQEHHQFNSLVTIRANKRIRRINRVLLSVGDGVCFAAGLFHESS